MLSSHLGEDQIATLAASRNKFGAGTENRTRILTLARSQATIASHPQILVVLEGNTPSSWPYESLVLFLNYSTKISEAFSLPSVHLQLTFEVLLDIVVQGTVSSSNFKLFL